MTLSLLFIYAKQKNKLHALKDPLRLLYKTMWHNDVGQKYNNFVQLLIKEKT